MPRFHSRNRNGISRIAAKPEGFERIEEASTLITLAVCTMLSLGIYLASYAFNGKIGGFLNLSSTGPAFQNPARVKSMPPFQLAGVKMGMTPLETASLYPKIHLSGQYYGQQEGRYRLGNGIYEVTFRGPDGAKQAYSLRYKEEFQNFSEAELRQHLIRKFGRPSESQCTKVNPVLGWECRLQWRRPDGVTIDTVTKTFAKTNGVRKTQLELKAVDPYRKNFMLRTKDDSIDPVILAMRSRTILKRSRNQSFSSRMKLISAGAKGR